MTMRVKVSDQKKDNQIISKARESRSRTNTVDIVPTHPILHLQQTIGNQAVQRLINSGSLLLPKQEGLGLGTIEVSLHYASTREVRWLYWKLGVRIPGTPPDVNWGNDGTIPNKYRKTVQFAYDMVYRIVNGANFARKLAAFKKTATKIPEISALDTAKLIQAVKKMVIHLADTSKNSVIQKEIKAERRMPLETQTAGYTLMGTNNVYIREFAFKQGIDTLASLILHESLHVASIPMGPLMIYEQFFHGFEAKAGFPGMMGGGEIKPIPSQPQGFSGLTIDYKLWKIGGTEGLPSDLKLEILDDERKIVFQKNISNSPGTYSVKWDGKDQRGNQVSWGLYTVRIVSLVTLHGSTLLEVKRY